MASYKILSNRLTVGKQGQIIDEALLADANIKALVEGGHIEPVSAKVKEEVQESKDK